MSELPNRFTALNTNKRIVGAKWKQGESQLAGVRDELDKTKEMPNEAMGKILDNAISGR